MKRTFVADKESGKIISTDETKETDWCTYESVMYDGDFSKTMLDELFISSIRQPKMRELRAFGEELGMAEEEIVSWMKPYLIKSIVKHDKSEEVEDFTIGDIHLWLDGELRYKVWENLEYCRKMGIEDTTLRHNGLAFPMTVEVGWQLYYAVIGYARDTWNVTETHKAEVQKIDSIQGLIDYEDTYKNAYPPKLAF